MVTKGNLNEANVKKLVTGKCFVLIIDKFITGKLSTQLTNNLLSYGYQGYTNAPSIGRIGMAFYETENKKIF